MGSKEEQESKEEQCSKEEHGSKEKQRDCLKNEIKYDYGNVFYTYVAQHKNADCLECLAHLASLFQIALIAITYSGILVNLQTDSRAWMLAGGIASVVSLFLKLSMMEFKPHDKAIKHRNAANDLWKIKKEYISLLTEFNSLEDNEIKQKRDELSEKVADVNKYYPAPDPCSYCWARKSIKENDYSFDMDELDELLPKGIE